MNKMRLILAAAMAIAAWGIQSPVHAIGFEVTDAGTFANNGTTVTSPPANTVDQDVISGSATGENSTTAGGTTISEAFTAPTIVGSPYDVVTDIDFYTNTAFSSITGWTVEISQLGSVGTGTVSNSQTLTAQPTGGGYTPLGTNTQTGTSGIYVQITPGNSNYIQLIAGDVYVITIGTTGTGTFAPQTTSTTVTGMTAGTLSGSTFTAATGNFTFLVDTIPVPEPSSWALIPVIGTIAFLGMRRLRFAPVALS